jgi:hypothetical protein
MCGISSEMGVLGLGVWRGGAPSSLLVRVCKVVAVALLQFGIVGEVKCGVMFFETLNPGSICHAHQPVEKKVEGS